MRPSASAWSASWSSFRAVSRRDSLVTRQRDQRYFRIQIWTGQNQAHYADIIVLVPEQEAPESLVELWQKGEGCVWINLRQQTPRVF
jgi:hypothetical protein